MRDIKFRAWDRVDSCMLSWNFMMQSAFNDKDSNLLYSIFKESTLHSENIHLMQYTGLHNKNGKELYEEDIVVIDYVVKGHAKCVICYDSNQAKYKAVPIATYESNSGSGGWTGFELFTNCEIIGNVYENPKLLEKGTL